jgi:Na+/melibiose symporter-like transporter
MKIMETEPARLPLGMKLGYGVGDFAFNLGFQVCALYLIYFFTDIYMIPAAVAGSIFMERSKNNDRRQPSGTQRPQVHG